MALNQENDEEQLGKLALQMASGAVLQMVLKSALDLNIIDIVSAAGDGTFLSPSEIASRISTKNPDAPVMLDRMLRLLASYGVLKLSVRTKDDGKVERLYGVGPLSRFFTPNESGGSMGPMLLLICDKVYMQSWYHLNDVILEGGIPFNMAYGMTPFEYAATDQRFNKVFNHAMSGFTTLIIKKILDDYRGFEDLKELVDVGGGNGATLNMITSKYPHIKGISYDLPHVVANAPSYPGVEHVGGDMFKSVPKGDAIFMKSILHDWSDEHCLMLLKNCWKALPPLGKVIIVELILPEVPDMTSYSTSIYELDLVMLAQHLGGKERTHKEFEVLALKSGFLGCEVKFCAYDISVMELHKKAE